MSALNPTENTFGEDPDAPLRVAKMQDVHSLLVFRFAAKLSPVHSFLLRGINFAEVLFLWRVRSRRDYASEELYGSIREATTTMRIGIEWQSFMRE